MAFSSNFESILEPEDTLLYAADERSLHGPPPPITVTDRWCSHLGSAVPYDIFQTHVRLNMLHQHQLQSEAVMVATAKRFGDQLRTNGQVKAMVNNAVKGQKEWLSDPTCPKPVPSSAIPSPASPPVAVGSPAERKPKAPGSLAGTRRIGSAVEVQRGLKPSAPSPRAALYQKPGLGFGVGATQAMDASNAWLNALRGSFHLRTKGKQPKRERATPPPTAQPSTKTLTPEPLVEVEPQECQEGDEGDSPLECGDPILECPEVYFDAILERLDAKPMDSELARRPSTPCSSKFTPGPQLPPAGMHPRCPPSPQDPRPPSPCPGELPSASPAAPAHGPGVESPVAHAIAATASLDAAAMPQQDHFSWPQPPVSASTAELADAQAACPPRLSASGPRLDSPTRPDRAPEYRAAQQQALQERMAEGGSPVPAWSAEGVTSSSSGWAQPGATRPHMVAPNSPSSKAAASPGASPGAKARSRATDAAPGLLDPWTTRAQALPPAPLSPAKLFQPAAALPPPSFSSSGPHHVPRSPRPVRLQHPATVSVPDFYLLTSSTDQRPEEDSLAARVLLPPASPRKLYKGGQAESQLVERCRVSPPLSAPRLLPLLPGQWQLQGIGIKPPGIPTVLSEADLNSFDRPRQRVSLSGGSVAEVSYWPDVRSVRHSYSPSPPPDCTPAEEPTRSSAPVTGAGTGLLLRGQAQGAGKVWTAVAATTGLRASATVPVNPPLYPEEELLPASLRLQPLPRALGPNPRPLQHASSLPSRPGSATSLQDSTADVAALKAPCFSVDVEAAAAVEQNGGFAPSAENRIRKAGSGSRLAPLTPGSSLGGR